ncbi:glycosyltransferase family 4 protein [Actinoplanes sp. Pm04-4]|uniref:Glycosyltransferase family 4 protein n=1 Tax=Paractinoplanes pyxinae TaxID=2997416 RepID=A0ABT4AVC1_9ACTN|nr:glycosyltransferase family 4 protein [Actinoplanes pyxinae]MCY1138183.1 glycosyltransferase family 4 protein [Actinoplanes pyxinae]
MAELNVLVYPHAMEVGGSQLNAIELAAAVRDLGHRVAVIGEDGPLLDRIHGLGLEHLPLPSKRRRPSPSVASHLRSLVRERGLTVVHGYEWPPALEAAAAAYGNPGTAAVCTVMSMAVAPFLPATMPLVVGTAALQKHSAARRPGPVHLIEPPVDVRENAPDFPAGDFRAEHGLDGSLLLGVVCRLVPELKLEGLLTAIDVVGRLGAEHPLQLVVVGDGPARDQVAEHARKANAEAGRTAVVLTGQLMDPRPAYAAADIMLGMGGSALRALAFGKPLVVQGERGFWELLTRESCPLFLEQGWYGIGDGTGGPDRLAAILRQVIGDAALRERLGRYGRELAVERFSLQRAARVQEDIYRTAVVSAADGGQTRAGLRSAAGLISYKVRRRYEGMRGTAARDDFNAATLASSSMRGQA